MAVDYLYVFQIGVSMLIIIVIGFIVFKFKFLPTSIVQCLNQYLLKICYFPLIFRSIGKRKFADLNFMPFVVGILTTIATHILLCMIFLFKFQDKLKAYLSVTLPCSFVNYLVIGIPIFNAIWGEENNVVVSLISLSNDLMTTPIYLVLSNIYLAINQKDDGHPKITKCQVFKNIIIRIVTSPIIIANVCGFIWSVIGWEFPEIIVSLTNFSGNIVLGISLLCVGGFIAQNSFIACKIAKLICCMLIRHIVMPLITMGFCFALKLNNDLSRQCVILQSLPTGTTSFVLSNAAGISPGVSSTMSFWSTCLSVLFIMLWMYILDALHLWVD